MDIGTLSRVVVFLFCCEKSLQRFALVFFVENTSEEKGIHLVIAPSAQSLSALNRVAILEQSDVDFLVATSVCPVQFDSRCILVGSSCMSD